MKHDKSTEGAALQVYQPKLDNIPGWTALSAKKQGELYEHTSHIHQYRQMQNMGRFGELVELVHVHLLLDGEDMKMDPYVAHIYPNDHERTIKRKVEALSEISATIPKPILKQISSIGQDVLSSYDHLLTAALGDIRNAVREMPLLPVSTEKNAEHYLEELNGKISAERKNRPKLAKMKKSKSFAEQAAANAVIHYLRIAGLKTSAEKRQFLTRVCGWAMEIEAVHGTLRCGRIAPPEGVGRTVGRPRKQAKDEVA